MSQRSSTLVKIATAIGLLALLSGCVVGDGDDARHLQPLPAKLVSQMSTKGMSQADPIFIRIFKKESELEVWKRDRSGRFSSSSPCCSNVPD